MRFSSLKYMFCSSSVVLTALLGGSVSVQAAEMNLSPTSDWSVSRVGGDVPYCTVARQYTDNIVLSFARNTNNNLAIGFDFQTNKLNANAEYEVGVETSYGAGTVFTVNPIGPTAFILGLADDSVLRNQLWTAPSIKISINEDVYSIATQEFGQGREMLQTCLSSFAMEGNKVDTTPATPAPSSANQQMDTDGGAAKPSIGMTEITDSKGNKVTVVVPESMKSKLENVSGKSANTVRSLPETDSAAEEITQEDVEDTGEASSPEEELVIDAEVEEEISPETSVDETISEIDRSPVKDEITQSPPIEETQVEAEDGIDIGNKPDSNIEETPIEDAFEVQADDNEVESTAEETEDAEDITADLYKNNSAEDLEAELFGEEEENVLSTPEKPASLPTQQTGGDENSSMKLHMPPAPPEGLGIEGMDSMDEEGSDFDEEGMRLDENESMLGQLKAKSGMSSQRMADFDSHDLDIQDLQQRAEDLIRENDELKQALSSNLENNMIPEAGGAGMSPQEIAAVESEISFLKSENERLNASLKELSLMSGDKVDMASALRRQLVDLGDTLEKVASDKAALEIELAAIKASANQAEGSDDPDLQRMAMEGKYQEAQREIRRLAMMMEEQEMKFEQEKKKLENMLFDPAVTEEHQRAYVAKLEQELKIANQALAEQCKMYENKSNMAGGAKATMVAVEPQAGGSLAIEEAGAHAFDLKEVMVKDQGRKFVSYQDAVQLLNDIYPEFKVHETSASLAKWSVDNGRIWGAVSKVSLSGGFEEMVEQTLSHVRNECQRDVSVEPSLLKAGHGGYLYAYDVSCGNVNGGLIFYTDDRGEVTMFALEASQDKKLDMFVQKDALVGALIQHMGQAKQVVF